VGAFDFDFVVVGSGFGGSVMTCRLAEKGYSVCLLERGNEFKYGDFPRDVSNARKFFWDPENNLTGLYEANYFRKSDAYIICGSALGGGSHLYANVLMEMPDDFFKSWPGGITRRTLNPFYAKALDMLEGSPYPINDPQYSDTPKTHAFVEAYKKAYAGGKPDDAPVMPELTHPNLAIRFKGSFPGEQSPNKHGVTQSSCDKCGGCDAGCGIHAKNTLDLNYLAAARKSGAEIRTQAEAVEIAALDGGGYSVAYKNPLAKKGDATTALRAAKVVVSAGSYGSTGLLLKMKKAGKLKNLSDKVGAYWCGNGDLEGSILEVPKDVNIARGPVITTAISYRFPDYPDGFPYGMVIQDAGGPYFLAWFLTGYFMPFPTLRKVREYLKAFWRWLLNALFGMGKPNFSGEIYSILSANSQIDNTMILLGMGRDRHTGRLFLDKKGNVELEWKMRDGSQYHYDHAEAEMKRLAKAMGGKFLVNPLTYLNKVLAVHPLGGCIMADDPSGGVVGTDGQAFGHPGLYVVDASILPTSTGVNPSFTIAATAEMIASQIPNKAR
jgi:cholesterol oxidase